VRETPAVMIPGPGIRGDQSGDLDTGGSARYANMVVFGPNSERAVVRRERGLAHFALQDRQLVPQRKDLHVLVAVAHRQQAYERERIRQGEIGQSRHGRSSSPKGSGSAVRESS